MIIYLVLWSTFSSEAGERILAAYPTEALAIEHCRRASVAEKEIKERAKEIYKQYPFNTDEFFWRTEATVLRREALHKLVCSNIYDTNMLLDDQNDYHVWEVEVSTTLPGEE